MLNCFYVLDEPGKRHARRTHKTQAVSDWLNPNSLGIMSAFAYIRLIASKSLVNGAV